MTKSFTVTIDTCSECQSFDGEGMNEVYCEHNDMPRGKDGKYVDLSATIDPYDEIHDDCPCLKQDKGE